MLRHHLQVWRLRDENVMFSGAYRSVCEAEAYRKVLITLVNLSPKAEKEAEHSITSPRMTRTSEVDKLGKTEKAAVTQSRVTGYIFSPGRSICGIILISYACWSCKLLNDLTPRQCVSARLNLLHNHLFHRRLRWQCCWAIFKRFGYDALEEPRSHTCVWVKLSALTLDSVLLPLSKTFFLLEAFIKKWASTLKNVKRGWVTGYTGLWPVSLFKLCSEQRNGELWKH